MKLSKSLFATAIIGSCLVAPVANAQETVLQNLVSRMLTSVEHVTLQNIKKKTTESVANAAHGFSTTSEALNTKVTVTEIAATEKTNKASKSE